MMKCRKRITFILIVVVLALLIPYPFPIELDDGGTVIYRAALWSVEERHRLWQESDDKGYMVGTVIRVLSFEIYNDVVFVQEMLICGIKKYPILS